MVVEPESPDSAKDAVALIEDLSTALERDEFFLVYQPTIDLQTDAFAGVEALLRWRHPVRGVVNPEAFISELEASGHIVPVGRWTLDTVCAQAAAWHAKGYRFAVSINISSKQLELSQFTQDVADALASSRFDPALLVLEFSQKTLAQDADASHDHLLALKDLGVRLAVDDFAPGDSPLDNLEAFPIDIVKLDKGFIAGITNTEVVTQIHNLVQLARSMKVQIFASGIEDAEQVKRLQLEEVDIGQGFFFSTPHEAFEIDRFLEDFAIFSGKPL